MSAVADGRESWVMLEPSSTQPFTPLPHEQTLYKSPARTTFSLQSLNKFPGKEPAHWSASAGTLYLTNRRLVYLPTTPTPQLQSFSVPLLNTHDSHVVAPWIGPNVWTALAQPVQGGGIPTHIPALELKFSFKDGGAYDFHSGYERVKERLQQQVDVARQSGHLQGDGSEAGRGRGGDALAAVDVANVHLDDLPAYEETGSTIPMPQPHAQPVTLSATTQATRSPESHAPEVFTPPAEPPPGYEQVQRETVEDELERRLSSGRIL
ncbi:hypothetical protein D6D02_01404 [Aureobasidium pullulans]|uniref:WW-domain-binding protein n=1 Tax=Aureobasidium pullulans TaxID=5580 RepID=A0A4S9L0E0_AURPU|nr:hypothetical protein D6D10_00397 [Aureobasidium pullulans]THY21855.1 hypothetical protein D6D02_01404 [Aureobasidium pullulans]